MTGGIPRSRRALGEIGIGTRRTRLEPLDFCDAVPDLQGSNGNTGIGTFARDYQRAPGSVKVQQFADDLGESRSQSGIYAHEPKHSSGNVFFGAQFFSLF